LACSTSCGCVPMIFRICWRMIVFCISIPCWPST